LGKRTRLNVAIDDKPTAAWTESDLTELCVSRRREQPQLEFKQELSLDTEADKKEVERDVEGLANAGGGHIIYGIVEETLPDGSKAAASLRALADGALYERLNNHLDSRGTPRIPFSIYAIDAARGGIFLAVEVYGHRRPHMANDGRYYVRRNLLVRQMTEAEVGDAYRQRFIREANQTTSPATTQPAPEARVRRGLSPSEDALFREETHVNWSPGWLAVWTRPDPPGGTILDPRTVSGVDLVAVQAQPLWREHPLRYFQLQKTNEGFVGRLPPTDEAYPHYWVKLWRDGLFEYGDLQASVVREEHPRRLIATHAVAEYVHDFMVLAGFLYSALGFTGPVSARASLFGVRGYALAVDGARYDGPLTVTENHIESDTWHGDATALVPAAESVAHELADRIFIAAGADRSYFFDSEGRYTGGR
jgi:hypothetical protein